MSGGDVTGLGDMVHCFMCGLGLRHWEPVDDPWLEHLKWSQVECPFVRITKGDEFMNIFDNEPVCTMIQCQILDSHYLLTSQFPDDPTGRMWPRKMDTPVVADLEMQDKPALDPLPDDVNVQGKHAEMKCHLISI